MFGEYGIGDFLFDKVVPWFLGTFFLIVLSIVLLAGVDSLQSWRAQHTQFACRANGMDFNRYFLSTKGVCAPVASHKSDTLTVHLPEGTKP